MSGQPDRELETAAGGTAAPVEVGVDPRARTALVVLLLGPGIAALHFAVVYLATEAGCSSDGPGLDAFDPPVPTVVTLVATALAALGCAAAAAWAHRRWRGAGEVGPGQLVDRGPLAFVGLQLALLSLVTVLLVGLPALVLAAC